MSPLKYLLKHPLNISCSKLHSSKSLNSLHYHYYYLSQTNTYKLQKKWNKSFQDETIKNNEIENYV